MKLLVGGNKKMGCQRFGLYLWIRPQKFCHRLSLPTGKGNITVLCTLNNMNENKQNC